MLSRKEKDEIQPFHQEQQKPEYLKKKKRKEKKEKVENEKLRASCLADFFLNFLPIILYNFP